MRKFGSVLFFSLLGAFAWDPHIQALEIPLTGATGLICDVKAFGAKGDGISKDTQAIQAAINACAGAGGTVDLHDGIFLSGMITLKSGITFRIEPTATLKGTRDDNDYPHVKPPTAQ